MTRNELLLCLLAGSQGRPFTPVQLQKAAFLVTENVAGIVDDGPAFGFVPYDYGPFDATVYQEAQALAAFGHAVITRPSPGCYQTYAASESGLIRGQQLLNDLDPAHRDYLQKVVTWVRSLPFSALVKSIYEAYPDMRRNSVFRG